MALENSSLEVSISNLNVFINSATHDYLTISQIDLYTCTLIPALSDISMLLLNDNCLKFPNFLQLLKTVSQIKKSYTSHFL